MYVEIGGPTLDPSQDCCSVIKNVDIPCACKYLTSDIQALIDMDKVVHVADFCGVPLEHGSQCGSYTVP
ncbi:hypothetical protein Tsubulata_015248 [Turnera subulata]|uniref:Bifunctional inhibitor/plant lipid transfer protein/seed storage helical domain-containing protein n=1 Tax=Turnera subulata TaxID=218843 RepID=A0A9Q0F609_9ROSI|nr:hypothetical protein Tsubulata_015248 [Turnera subulata]